MTMEQEHVHDWKSYDPEPGHYGNIVIRQECNCGSFLWINLYARLDEVKRQQEQAADEETWLRLVEEYERLAKLIPVPKEGQ